MRLNSFLTTTLYRILYLSAAGALFFLSPVFSQEMPAGSGNSGGSIQLSSESTNLQNREILEENGMQSQAAMAFTSQDYLVTPGDVYILSFFRSMNPVSQNLIVENDLSINLGILGEFDASGMTFDQAKVGIEEQMRRSYSDSAPKLLIRSLGSFRVLVKGKVKQAGYMTVNGLSRLSSVVKTRRTAHASERSIMVRSRDGDQETYDLFRAERYGEMDQDPYLRPGDVIVLERAERRVALNGEVYRSGSYELRRDEGLKELIEVYGEGLSANALPSEVKIVRYGAEASEEAEIFYVDFEDAGAVSDIQLRDNDRVTVPNKLQYRPVVYFEGALRAEDGDLQAVTGQTESVDRTARYSRIKYTFEQGKRLSSALRDMQSRFRLESDLANAYLLRSGSTEPIHFDIELYLLGKQSEDVELKHGDTIVIPFKQLFVILTGAVKNPGIYNYVQGRNYEYYLSLAGGIDRNQHWFGTGPKITDPAGHRVPEDAEIEPEYRIDYSHNNPFRVITPIATVTSAVVSTILVIQNMLR